MRQHVVMTESQSSLCCLMFELTAEEKDHFGTAWTQSSYFALELSEVDSNSSSLEPWPSHGGFDTFLERHTMTAVRGPPVQFAKNNDIQSLKSLEQKRHCKTATLTSQSQKDFLTVRITCNLPSNRLPFCPSKHLTACLAEVLTRTAPESQRFPISRLLRLLHLSTRSVKTAMSYLVPRWRIS